MPQRTNPFRLGTRGSRLARAQAELVQTALLRAGTPCEILVLKTSGDRIQDRPLASAGGKGLFTKELEDALLVGEIDLAVHSMKDVPTLLPSGLVVAAILHREDPRDVFLSPRASSLADLPAGASVGTSSVRRSALVRRARPDVAVKLLRGNVDTRLRKLDGGDFDAIILALAGLKRLGAADRAIRILEIEDWLPALAQGAIGVEIRAGDAALHDALRPLDHAPSAIAIACERAFQAALDGSCSTAMGGLARLDGDVLKFRGQVLSPDGAQSLDCRFECSLGENARQEAERGGREAGLALRPKVLGWL